MQGWKAADHHRGFSIISLQDKGMHGGCKWLDSVDKNIASLGIEDRPTGVESFPRGGVQETPSIEKLIKIMVKLKYHYLGTNAMDSNYIVH